jgi:hypothetical protein
MLVQCTHSWITSIMLIEDLFMLVLCSSMSQWVPLTSASQYPTSMQQMSCACSRRSSTSAMGSRRQAPRQVHDLVVQSHCLQWHAPLQ